MKTASRSLSSNSRRGQGTLAAILLAPSLLIIGAFGFAPALYSLYLSLFEIRGRHSEFIALENYNEALHSPHFWNSFWNTIYYAIGAVPLTLGISYVIAITLFRLPRFQGLFRTAFFIPYITSVVAAAMIWRVFFEPRFGLANYALEGLGMAPQQWLLEPRGILHILSNGVIPHEVGPSLALCCVILFEVWRNTGFVVVILLAALTNVPRELEEAARIDGAPRWRVQWSIVIPLLSPTLLFLTIITTIGAFQAFGNLYALTGDGRGPLDTTQNLTVYLFTTFYANGRLGYGAAVATLLCAAIVLLTAAQWRFVGSKVFYR